MDAQKTSILRRMWHLVRMWWVVQLLRWYGPEQARHERQLEISRENDKNGTQKKMVEMFGAEAYGLSIQAQAAMDFARDFTEPKIRKKTLINDYIYFWLWKMWRPELQAPKFARWKSNATRAIDKASSEKFGLIEERDSLVSLTLDGVSFGIFHLLALILEELEPIQKRMSGWKQLLLGAGGVGFIWMIVEVVKIFLS